MLAFWVATTLVACVYAGWVSSTCLRSSPVALCPPSAIHIPGKMESRYGPQTPLTNTGSGDMTR